MQNRRYRALLALHQPRIGPAIHGDALAYRDDGVAEQRVRRRSAGPASPCWGWPQSGPGLRARSFSSASRPSTARLRYSSPCSPCTLPRVPQAQRPRLLTAGRLGEAALLDTADQDPGTLGKADRTARYAAHVGKSNLVLGLRPEHIAETRPHIEPNQHDFDMMIDVDEPMGMETLIYFTLEGAQVCGRVNPNAGAQDGAPLRLAVDLNNMHLLNEVTGAVL